MVVSSFSLGREPTQTLTVRVFCYNVTPNEAATEKMPIHHSPKTRNQHLRHRGEQQVMAEQVSSPEDVYQSPEGGPFNRTIMEGATSSGGEVEVVPQVNVTTDTQASEPFSIITCAPVEVNNMGIIVTTTQAPLGSGSSSSIICGQPILQEEDDRYSDQVVTNENNEIIQNLSLQNLADNDTYQNNSNLANNVNINLASANVNSSSNLPKNCTNISNSPTHQASLHGGLPPSIMINKNNNLLRNSNNYVAVSNGQLGLRPRPTTINNSQSIGLPDSNVYTTSYNTSVQQNVPTCNLSSSLGNAPKMPIGLPTHDSGLINYSQHQNRLRNQSVMQQNNSAYLYGNQATLGLPPVYRNENNFYLRHRKNVRFNLSDRSNCQTAPSNLGLPIVIENYNIPGKSLSTENNLPTGISTSNMPTSLPYSIGYPPSTEIFHQNAGYRNIQPELNNLSIAPTSLPYIVGYPPSTETFHKNSGQILHQGLGNSSKAPETSGLGYPPSTPNFRQNLGQNLQQGLGNFSKAPETSGLGYPDLNQNIGQNFGQNLQHGHGNFSRVPETCGVGYPPLNQNFGQNFRPNLQQGLGNFSIVSETRELPTVSRHANITEASLGINSGDLNTKFTELLRMVPPFDGVSIHPVQFINCLEKGLMICNVPFNYIPVWGQNLFVREAKIWADAFLPIASDWITFKDLFLQQYWSPLKQLEIRNSLERGRYKSGEGTYTTYFMQCVTRSRFLEPPYPEALLISVVASHYPTQVGAALAGTNTIVDALTILRRLEYIVKPVPENNFQNNGRNFRPFKAPTPPVANRRVNCMVRGQEEGSDEAEEQLALECGPGNESQPSN